jgi:hypothetical protein
VEAPSRRSRGSRAAGASPLAETGTVSVDQQTVRFERPGLVEEYGVSLDGVRQDFVVTRPPAGVGELELRLVVTGEVQFRDGPALPFVVRSVPFVFDRG